MNSGATNIISYIHVCTTVIAMQMVVNFIVDFENNVWTKISGQNVFFEIIGPGGLKFEKFWSGTKHFRTKHFSDRTTEASILLS